MGCTFCCLIPLLLHTFIPAFYLNSAFQGAILPTTQWLLISHKVRHHRNCKGKSYLSLYYFNVTAPKLAITLYHRRISSLSCEQSGHQMVLMSNDLGHPSGSPGGVWASCWELCPRQPRFSPFLHVVPSLSSPPCLFMAVLLNKGKRPKKNFQCSFIHKIKVVPTPVWKILSMIS